MALADALAQASSRSHMKCAVGTVAAQLDPKDRAAFDAALARKSKTSRDIVADMTSHGYPLTLSPVMRHRRGDCTCGTR